MTLSKHILVTVLFTCLHKLIMALENKSSSSTEASGFTLTAAAFFVVLVLDLIAVIVLIVVIKYKKNSSITSFQSSSTDLSQNAVDKTGSNGYTQISQIDELSMS